MRKLFLMAAATAALLATAGAATSAAIPYPICKPGSPCPPGAGLVTAAPQLPGPKPCAPDNCPTSGG